MDRLNHYRKLIREILTDHTKVPYTHGDIKSESSILSTQNGL